jgi:hypothetical protein
MKGDSNFTGSRTRGMKRFLQLRELGRVYTRMNVTVNIIHIGQPVWFSVQA